MAGSPLLCGPRAGGVGILVLLLLGLLRLPPTLSARPVKEPRSLSARSAPLVETSTPLRLRRAVPRGEAAGAVPGAGARGAGAPAGGRDRNARVLRRRRLRISRRMSWRSSCAPGALRVPRTRPLAPDDDPDAPAAQLARALLRARLDPAALGAQLVPAPAPAPRPRPPVYDDGPHWPRRRGCRRRDW
uniref:IA4 n=1 Tax=Mus musculus TaxID=10090 RepID=Q9ESU4_MOUSE|nr:IA4 [Mus musculus]